MSLETNEKNLVSNLTAFSLEASLATSDEKSKVEIFSSADDSSF